MALAHVLLTGLLEKPSTGIDLARRFDRSMGFFWNASHQQIYRELSVMLAKGWICTLDIEYSDSRKKTYQVADLGLAELQRWIIDSSQPHKMRDELMVKLRAEAQLGQQQVLPELQRHLQAHQQQLALYQNIMQRDRQKQHQTAQRTFLIQQKILQLGMRFEQVWIDWLQEMTDVIQTADDDHPSH